MPGRLVFARRAGILVGNVEPLHTVTQGAESDAQYFGRSRAIKAG